MKLLLIMTVPVIGTWFYEQAVTNAFSIPHSISRSATSVHTFSSTILQASESSASTSNHNNNLTGKVIAQRYIYRLSPTESSTTSPFSVEERLLYSVGEDGTLKSMNLKSFILRQESNNTTTNSNIHSTAIPSSTMTKKNGDKRSFLHLGPVLHTIKHFHEGDSASEHPGGGRAGLGETIWDATFVMALYCAAYPEFYYGHVLELGSGTGLAAILSCITTARSLHSSKASLDLDSLSGQDDSNNTSGYSTLVPKALEKLTLTDINEPSLNMCRDNVLASSIPMSKVEVMTLDWHSRLPHSWHGKFNFIIASDCAYYYPLINPFARTVAYSLAPSPYDNMSHKQDIGGRFLHIGPDHRADAVKDLKKKLTRGYNMNTWTEGNIVLERFNLVPLVLDSLEKEDEQMVEEAERGFVEYQSMDTSGYTALLGHHHEDYDGANADHFFPAEIGSE